MADIFFLNGDHVGVSMALNNFYTNVPIFNKTLNTEWPCVLLKVCPNPESAAKQSKLINTIKDGQGHLIMN